MNATSQCPISQTNDQEGAESYRCVIDSKNGYKKRPPDSESESSVNSRVLSPVRLQGNADRFA